MSEVDKSTIKPMIVKRVAEGTLPREYLEQSKAENEKLNQTISSIQLEVTSQFQSINEQVRLYMAGLTHNVLPIVKDISRAKKTLDLVSDDTGVRNVIHAIQTNLDRDGGLSAAQIFFLILEARGIDTSKAARELAANGGRGKAGHKCDLYYALLEITIKIGDCSYAQVARYLNKQSSEIEYITIIKSELPNRPNDEGFLEFEDTKSKTNSRKPSTIESHLRVIRTLKK